MRNIIDKIRQTYDNKSLFHKIRMVICGLVISITFIVLLTSMAFYLHTNRERTGRLAQENTTNAANTIGLAYTTILEHFVETCGTDDFVSDLHILSDPEEAYTYKKSILQSELSSLAGCHYIVNSAILLSGDQTTYYSLYKNTLNVSGDFLSQKELDRISGITWLSKRKSPFLSRDDVIVVVFPVKADGYSSIRLTKGKEKSDAYVMILLDSKRLNTVITNAGADNTNGEFFISNQNGELLNPSDDPAIRKALDRPQRREFLQGLSTQKDNLSSLKTKNVSLYARNLEKSDLYLVNYVENEKISTLFGRSGILILAIALLMIIVLLALSFLLTRYITSPLNTLVNVVTQIGSDSYTKHIHVQTNDEMGQVFRAINSMHDTIQEQMQLIKKEEQEKYSAQVRVLSEQINPHFLYNTLDYVQLEVMNGHNTPAAEMIQYLVEYLRIGLSYGDETITIANEIKHVHSYIKIMNQRFSESIVFMYQIAPGLEKTMILKTILQPLVENSIKHGFSIDSGGVPVASPSIEISFFRHADILNIEITDNGSGFDPQNVEKALQNGEPEDQTRRHVGIHNVYQRLCTYYGRENISFNLSSMPFYKNTIFIHIHLSHQEKDESYI